jgi:hypothetical protein
MSLYIITIHNVDYKQYYVHTHTKIHMYIFIPRNPLLVM